MRRAPAWMAAIGVLSIWLEIPTPASAASVWVTLAAGLPGSATPTDSSEFTFDNAHGPPLVAVDQLTGGVTAQAATGGGSSFFGGEGTPVLLNLADGSAYLAGGSPPSGATNSASANPASAAPVAGGSVPSNAALLGVNLAEPSGNSRSLTASVTDSAGDVLGTGSLKVPTDGWFVLGLSPTDPANQSTNTGSLTPPANTSGSPPPTPETGGTTSGSGSTSGSGAAPTPEPTTLALAAIGVAAAHAWRRIRLTIAPI